MNLLLLLLSVQLLLFTLFDELLGGIGFRGGQCQCRLVPTRGYHQRGLLLLLLLHLMAVGGGRN